jgi:hypothetical protein
MDVEEAECEIIEEEKPNHKKRKRLKRTTQLTRPC